MELADLPRELHPRFGLASLGIATWDASVKIPGQAVLLEHVQLPSRRRGDDQAPGSYEIRMSRLRVRIATMRSRAIRQAQRGQSNPCQQSQHIALLSSASLHRYAASAIMADCRRRYYNNFTIVRCRKRRLVGVL